MPAPISVADEQVIEAGRQLAAAGKRVTGWTLRAVLGTGKPARLLEVWTAHAVAAEEATPPPVNLPAAMEEQAGVLRDRLVSDLASLVSALWQTADTLTAERVKSEVDATRRATADVRADLEAAEAAVSAAEAQRDGLAAEVEQLTKDLSSCQVQTAEQRGRAESAERLVERAEAAAREAEAALRAAAEDRGRLLERVERAEARTTQPTPLPPTSAPAPGTEASAGRGSGEDVGPD